ncbi:hypothetical protein V1523DRAFT_429361 [Lipomyces doorenjongii]
MKGALTSSSGTLYTAGNKINRRDINRSEELSIIGSNENALVRLEIRNQIETAQLCTVISRPALELVYAEVIKKLHLQIVEGGTEDACSCSIWHRYLLPCLHRIQLGVPIDVADIHPRWRVHPVFPPLNINWAHIDPETLSNVKDPQVGLPRKGRPRGTRRLPTSAEIVQKPQTERKKCPKLVNQESPQEMAGRDSEGQATNEIPVAVDDGNEDEYGEWILEEMWDGVRMVM